MSTMAQYLSKHRIFNPVEGVKIAVRVGVKPQGGLYQEPKKKGEEGETLNPQKKQDPKRLCLTTRAGLCSEI